MYTLRFLQQKDNAQLAEVIRAVSKEFGLAPEKGFAVADPTLDDLYNIYYGQAGTSAAYWVIVDDADEVCGGGGVAPLNGEETNILEVQKMYFLPKVRQQGFARTILNNIVEFAQQHKYEHLYIETTENLSAAVELYKKMGFYHIDGPLGNTGHSGACEIYMEKKVEVEQ